jgi:Meiotically up-regulated gene 113/Domain of unknown function (DUF4041)
MNYLLIIGVESGVCILLLISFLFYRNKTKKALNLSHSLNEKIAKATSRLSDLKIDLVKSTNTSKKVKGEIEINEQKLNDLKEKRNSTNIELEKSLTKLKKADQKRDSVNEETQELQKLKSNKDQLANDLKSYSGQLQKVKDQIITLGNDHNEAAKQRQEIMSSLDLYSRLQEFVATGHYEEPDYLFRTSARFAEEIKRTRLKQKELVKVKNAVTFPDSITITDNTKADQKILAGQVNLMLTAFNIEVDLLIGKVRPSNYTRSLEQIDKIATKLEKSAATLHCGFNTDYVKLKYEECTLQYQHTLKKQEEQEEQRLLKEQMREEVKAQKEFEKAIAEAEKEERMYRKMLERAKEALEGASEDDRIIALQRIEDLEQQLAEATEKEERAKSLAEQTRRGHVYVISNIGSFGEGIYKIGLTRRLDPIDRVKELGDASVPFKFDIHAIIYAEDAPTLETELHRKFKHYRVNSVNLRKEFFRVELPEIKTAVTEMVDKDIDFKMTALAEDYYETRRLRENLIN